MATFVPLMPSSRARLTSSIYQRLNFQIFPSWNWISVGREKNFVYSHKHAPGVAYRAQPKAEGIGFGGTSGKERIWLNEDFGSVTVRHHAVDKTYQAGSLAPNQVRKQFIYLSTSSYICS